MRLGIVVSSVAPIDVQHQRAHRFTPFGELVTLLSLTQDFLPLLHLAALRCIPTSNQLFA